MRLVGGLLAALAALAAGAGCRLGPLVDDQPGASANVLPADADIPSVTRNADLTNQIVLNDSLDTSALDTSGNVIQRGTGVAPDGAAVKFWPFGEADRAPTPIYVFGTGDPASPSFAPLPGHPPMVEVVPGDVDYEPIHTIFNVKVTDSYKGQKITTLGALSDAIDLKLVEEPVAIEMFVNWPIVRPGLRLEVAPGTSIAPTPIYAHGYLVDSFPLGGALGRQPNPRGLLPTSQVSFLRGAKDPDFDRKRPIFQASIPPGPAQTTANYTPLSMVLEVELTGDASAVTRDSDLFTRSATGDITVVKSIVSHFTVTSELVDLQLQFAEGAP